MTAKAKNKVRKKVIGKTAKKSVTVKASKKTAKNTVAKSVKKPAGAKGKAVKRASGKGPAAKTVNKKPVFVKSKVVDHKPKLPPKTVLKLGAREKRFYKDLLMAMRERLREQITMLTRQSLQRDDAVVSEEDGTDAYERQFALTLASSEQDSLFEIDNALRRLDEGKYGICENCGCFIRKPRLEALPFVRMCIECQSETEKGRAKVRYPDSARTR